MELRDATHFNKLIDGKNIALYTLRNKKGMTAQFTNYGATLVSLFVKDKHGPLSDVVLGYDSLDDYLTMKNPYFGRTIGRYGNRIAHGRFTINQKEYALEQNDRGHNLHSGSDGFHHCVWEAVPMFKNAIQFRYTSKDGHGGFPGNLTVKVTFTLTDNNALDIDYEATTDQLTHVNLTHHSYFNLNQDSTQSIENHTLKIDADTYLPVDHSGIPLGNLQSVAGTPFDFRNPKNIKKDIAVKHPQLEIGNGYDHTFVLNGNGLREVCVISEIESGRIMTVITNEPGIQFYSGNSISSQPPGKNGSIYKDRSGFCLESQHFPDTPNRENFPTTLLHPDEMYTSRCIYQFDLID